MFELHVVVAAVVMLNILELIMKIVHRRVDPMTIGVGEGVAVSRSSEGVRRRRARR
jgi:hypothetical protein